MKFKSYKFIALIIAATIQLCSTWASDVQKVTENCYVAKISDRNLGLVMERVERSLFPWDNYIDKQLQHPQLRAANDLLGKGAHLEDGLRHFKDVLDTVSRDNNEIWIAYITPDILSEKVNALIQSGKPALRSIFEIYHDLSFMNNIEMFVTVTSSPHALITTHMGIARSVENVINNRAKGTSLDLHAFAAKVMLARNPARKYMINAPVPATQNIVINALSNTGAVHVGTKEMLKNGHKYELELMKQYPPILSVDSAGGRVIESSFTVYDRDQRDKPWLTVNKDNKNYVWMFEEVFQPTLGIHYIAVDLEKLANSRKCERLDVK